MHMSDMLVFDATVFKWVQIAGAPNRGGGVGGVLNPPEF